MTFLDAKNYLTAMLFKSEQKAVPLNLKIGQPLNIQTTPFLKLGIYSSLVNPPKANETIKAISHAKLSGGNHIWKFHLKTEEATQDQQWVQIFTDPQGVPLEAYYFSKLVRFTPENQEDQEIYTGVKGYGLGDTEFTLSQDNLMECDADPDRLALTFKENSNVIFERDAGSKGDVFMTPFEVEEIRIDDSNGATGQKLKSHFMLYERTVSEEKELLLISMDFTESKNGDESKQELWVNFSAGIPLDLARLTVSQF